MLGKKNLTSYMGCVGADDTSKILEEKDWPKDCYVFQGEQDQPTIIYMPLFNRKNCKGSMLCKYKAMGNTSIIIISTDLVRERRALILY